MGLVSGLGYRGLRILLLGGGSVLLYVFLEPRGYGWAVLPLLLGAMAVVALVAWIRARRARRHGRWTDALIDASKRSQAIGEIRREREALGHADAKAVEGYAHLTILLAELVAIQGDGSAAQNLLVGALDLALAAPDRARVHYMRSVLCLRSGELENARQHFEEIGGALGEPALDLRVQLLDAAILVEEGNSEKALDIAARVQRTRGADENILVEARTVRAAALDALGQATDAKAIVQSLGPEVREVLVALGQPRLVRLVKGS